LHTPLVGLAGIHGDKKTGTQQIEIAADHSHYLRPFAKRLLALAGLRENKKPDGQRSARPTSSPNFQKTRFCQ
jgi:hypothetical protein